MGRPITLPIPLAIFDRDDLFDWGVSPLVPLAELSVEGGAGTVEGVSVTVPEVGEAPGTVILRPLLLDAEDVLLREKRLGVSPSGSGGRGGRGGRSTGGLF